MFGSGSAPSHPGRTGIACAAIALASALAIAAGPLPSASAHGADRAPASTVFVDAGKGSDRNDGRTARHAVHTLQEAQTRARKLASAGRTDVVVRLADGDYRLSKPLTFDSRDSGVNGHTVTWQGPDQGKARILGSSSVQNWHPSSVGNGIYEASVPQGTQTRQLYVDGMLAQRARTEVSRADMAATDAGYKPTASAAWLLTMPGIADAEIEGAGAWTSRFSPIDGVDGDVLTMQQPAWKLNTWGWDTLNSPFHNGPLVVENALALLDQPGEWFLNKEAGTLYYKPLAGQNMNSVDVELPTVESLINVAGTLDAPVHDVTFANLEFSGTTWNAPTSTGFADQQTSSYLATLDGVDTSNFESTRGKVSGIPAGVQVSAAHDITFTDSTFTNFGANAVGIGNDANATASGVGLAAHDITVTNSVFTQIAGSAVTAGGYLPDAHHPSDPRMLVSRIQVTNNVIHDVARYYTDNVGVLMTYVSDSVISHNEIFNLPYSGIAVGYGWGIPDAGGSSEYVRRGTYDYYPLYSTPTTMKNLRVEGNYVHDVLKIHTDGAPFYNLSASPGTVIRNNYFAGSTNFGMYFDEGTRFIHTTNNVVTTTGGQWWHANYVNSPLNGDMVTDGNYSNTGSNNSDQAGRNDSYSGNTVVSDQNWPAPARAIIYNAGVPVDLRVGAASTPTALYAGLIPEQVSNDAAAVTVKVPIGNASGSTISRLSAETTAPRGWKATIGSLPGSLAPGAEAAVVVTITPDPVAQTTPIATSDVSVAFTYRVNRNQERLTASTKVVTGLPVAAPLAAFTTSPTGVTGQLNDSLGIRVAGADIWGAGGQRDDQYGTIYQKQALSNQGSVTAFLDSQEAASPYTKSGVAVRNDLTGAGTSLGYASMYRLAGYGVAFALDTNGDGYLDLEYRQDITATGPIGLRLVRNGSGVSGFVSVDSGTTWTQVGPTRELVGAGTVVDAGIIHTSHDSSRSTTAVFHGMAVANASDVIVSAPAQATASNGASLTVPITVHNLGSGAIAEGAITAVAPAGWTVTIPSLPASIAPMGSATVNALVSPPSDTALSTGSIAFSLTYTSGSGAGSSGWSTAVGAALALPSDLSGFTTSATGLVGSKDGDLAIRVAGADIWGAGGQHDDEYGTIFKKGAIEGDGSVAASLDSQEAASPYTKSGVVVRNDLTQSGSAQGYAAMYRLAAYGVAFAVDTNGDGLIDTETRLGGITSGPILLRLTRTGSQISGFVSQDAGATWVQVGSSTTLVGAADTLDAGVIHTSHDAGKATTAHFSGLQIVR